METVDVTVIGAGWSGLAALKTYQQVDPSASIVLFESAASVGGVWAKHRLYAGLKSNNMLGTYEFSDFPMDASFGVQPGQHIPGTVIQTYMERFVEHFQLAPFIRLNTRVRIAEHNSDGTWTLTIDDANGERTVVSKKLIVCTGITSQPYLPTLSGQDTFDAPLFHCRDLPQHQDALLQPNKRITVFGGTKSAWDAVYAAATAGAHVDWIIRDNGHGPVWMAPAYVTPLKKWLEKLVTTRLLTWFSPCIWGDADGCSPIRNFLHGTWLGRKIVDTFWAILGNDLKPWVSPFWVASGLSILNYPTNFFDLVTEGKVRIHIDHITHLTAQTVHLASAGPIPSDTLICATGWQATPNIDFRPSHLPQTLGFPWAEDPIPQSVIQQADAEILTRFPRLAIPPPKPHNYTPLAPDAPATAKHPFRLARFMVPPALAPARSIAFMGLAMTINTTMLAQAQASGSRPTSPTTSPQPRGNNAPPFGVHRYRGGFGKRNPDFVFDAVPYVDLLLRDLGLDYTRKEGGLKWLVPYGVEDYRGLVEEWVGARDAVGKKDN
ncbi:flavin-binding monooxygenase-like protein [Aspergillus bombycis]|uniref:Flavin-binding monooxygenase-like protein n=1 Tax=Aspergillus bombycis TaxID=109264 RepID=A0A1F7ZSD2_9EURO|nr:flavin-binding monooxygenase-like protein [Aspergillus bombycis]OGM41995.1 flavin-binding monooxygenase-like protein [Aspergillus bombycis]